MGLGFRVHRSVPIRKVSSDQNRVGNFRALYQGLAGKYKKIFPLGTNRNCSESENSDQFQSVHVAQCKDLQRGGLATSDLHIDALSQDSIGRSTFSTRAFLFFFPFQKRSVTGNVKLKCSFSVFQCIGRLSPWTLHVKRRLT
jgi:hypothetical protein